MSPGKTMLLLPLPQMLGLLLLVPGVSGGRFWGVSASFTPKGINPDGTYQVDFRIKETFDYCYDWLRWGQCYQGNCGTVMSVRRELIYDSKLWNSYNLTWCQHETLMTRNLNSDKPFLMADHSCCWTNLRNYSPVHFWNWLIYVVVDLGVRSDTNKPNNSPLSSTMAFFRVQQNCPRSFNLAAFDPDGDQTRCSPFRALPAGFNLDQRTCTLSYQPLHSNITLGSYGIEIEVEDFPRQFINLTYSDGSVTFKNPIFQSRLRRAVWLPTITTNSTTPWYSHTAPATPPPHTQQQSSWVSTSRAPFKSSGPTTASEQTLEGTTPWAHYHNSPLSKMPLQFVVVVEPSVSSCGEGDYLPEFEHPTPHNGEKIHLNVNQNLEIQVRAMATYSQVHDIIVSGPANLTKSKMTNGDYILNWTPQAEHLNQHFPVCFIAESSNGSAFYQSELRCILIHVGHHENETPSANVICSENFMAIEVDKMVSDNIRLHEDHLRLNDPSCTLYSNGTHILANMSLHTCGTQMEEDETDLIFRNEIVSFNNSSDVITRHHQVELQFNCKYPKKGTVSLEFTAHQNPFVFVQKGFGTFSYQFEFFHSSHFQHERDPSTYPLEFEVGEMMYMQIEAVSPVNNTELFVESCVASPTVTPQPHLSYTIIQNGCKKDETVQFYSSHSHKVQFGMEAFKFIGLYDQVFITCAVILCEAGNPNTRCSLGCTNATAPPAVHHHHRRAAPIQTASHDVSQGPVRIRRSPDARNTLKTETTNGSNLLGVLAGCLIIVVAMGCYMVINIGRAKLSYQRLPNSDL